MVNPALLSVIIKERQKSIERYLTVLADKFFSELKVSSADGETDVNRVNTLFKEQLMKIPRWPAKMVENAIQALLDDLQSEFPYFDMTNELRSLLVPHLCANSDEHCVSSVEVNSRDVADFVHSYLVETSTALMNVMYVFDETTKYLEKQQTKEYVYKTSFEHSLIDFITRYRFSVANRKASRDTDDVVRPYPAHESKNIKSGGDTIDNIFSKNTYSVPSTYTPTDEKFEDPHLKQIVEHYGQPDASDKEDESKDETSEHDKIDQHNHDEDDDDREETEEERYQRHKQEDEDIDFANDKDSNRDIRNAFNNDFEIKDFNQYIPPRGSLLKKYNPTSIKIQE